MRRTPILLVAILLACGCEEEFPPYTEPENVLRAELVMQSPDTVLLYRDGVTGNYYLSTPMTFRVIVTNTYQDLLQGEARVGEQIVAQSFATVQRTMVVPLTLGSLLRPPVFQNTVALAPQSDAEFSLLWLPIGTDGRWVFEGNPFVNLGGDQLYGPISFLASADAQIFSRVQPVRTPQIAFTKYFRVRPQ